MSKIFYENVKLKYPQFVLLQYDGALQFRNKRKLKPKETLVNQIIIPFGKKRKLQLFKRLIRMIRTYLKPELIITPSKKCIKSNQRILNNFKQGGMT
jgi:hypothetical protein